MLTGSSYSHDGFTLKLATLELAFDLNCINSIAP